MSNSKNNLIPTSKPRHQSVPGGFDSSALALTPEGKPSGLKDYDDHEGDINNVSSFIDYTTTDKQAEGLPPIEIEIRDAEMFAKMVAREPDKYYRLLQNYHLKLTRAEMRAAQDYDIIQDLQAREALADNTRQEIEDDLRASEHDVQRLKKAEITLIATVTEREGTIKYLQSQLNKHIRNDTRHLSTAYNATQVSTPPATSPTRRSTEGQRRATSPA